MIFFIYLYQRWIYRVDPKRVNEFGTSQEMLENPQAAVEGKEDGANLPVAESSEVSLPSKSPSDKKED